ncbi:hypothetical protein DFP73DRAFT_542508 [Morchella snyderi]|nr:hypothetical protein DFP73DRAFT_542508 [Morchella snyderi]
MSRVQSQPRKRGRRRNAAQMQSLVDEGDVRGAVADAEAEAEAEELVVRETMGTRSQTLHYKNREGDTAGDEQQEARKQARKERKLKRKAEQRAEQAAGGLKPVWSCDVCKEPLLGEELTSHKAWHCQSGTGSGGAVAAEKTAQGANGVLSPPSPTPLPTLQKVACSPAQPQPQSQSQPQGSPIPAAAIPPTRPMPAPQPELAPPTPPSPPPTAKFFCEPCNRHLTVGNRTAHDTSPKHARKAAQYVVEMRAAAQAAQPRPPPSEPSSSTETFFCAPCNRSLAVVGRTGHYAGATHIKNVQAIAAAREGERRAKQAAAATAAAAKEKQWKARQAAAATVAAKENERRANQAAQESETRAKQASAATHNPPAPYTAPPSTVPKEYCHICHRYQFPGRMDDHCNTPAHKKKAEAAAQAAAALYAPGPMTGAQQGRVLPTAHGGRPRSPPPVGTGMQAEMCVPVGLGPGGEGDKWVKITGERFYCEVCERERNMQGLEDHVGSALHRRNAREREEAEGGGGTG